MSGKDFESPVDAELSEQTLASQLKGLRIALVGPLPPPYGGIANQTRQLAKLLTEEGVHVQVVQNNPPYQPGWIAGIRGIRALFRLVFFARALWRDIGQADLVHVMANSGWAWHLFAAPAIWIAWIRSKPVIVNYRGGGAERFFNKAWWVVRPTLGLARYITVPSGYLKEVFSNRGVLTKIVPNIINLSRFSPNGRWRTERDQIDGGWPHIVATRNLEPIYDIGTAIQAFQLVLEAYPSASMTIAGIGPDLTMLKALSTKLGVLRHIKFVGRLNNEEIATLYQKADLMMNPSLVDNMPISILEALASGVPVVSTNVGGIPYLVSSGETALLVPPGDSRGMAEAALSILGDADMARELIRKGVIRAEMYDWTSVRKSLFKVYS